MFFSIPLLSLCQNSFKKNQYQNHLTSSLQNPSEISLSSSCPSFHQKDRNPNHMNPLKKAPLATCSCHLSQLLLFLTLSYILVRFLGKPAFGWIVWVGYSSIQTSTIISLSLSARDLEILTESSVWKICLLLLFKFKNHELPVLSLN